MRGRTLKSIAFVLAGACLLADLAACGAAAGEKTASLTEQETALLRQGDYPYLREDGPAGRISFDSLEAALAQWKKASRNTGGPLPIYVEAEVVEGDSEAVQAWLAEAGEQDAYVREMYPVLYTAVWVLDAVPDGGAVGPYFWLRRDDVIRDVLTPGRRFLLLAAPLDAGAAEAERVWYASWSLSYYLTETGRVLSLSDDADTDAYSGWTQAAFKEELRVFFAELGW